MALLFFKGGKTNVTREIKDVWAPFSMGVHCEVHRTNLAIKSLSNLTFFSHLDVFMTKSALPQMPFKVLETSYKHGNQRQ
jgi:hypothetical protein